MEKFVNHSNLSSSDFQLILVKHPQKAFNFTKYSGLYSCLPIPGSSISPAVPHIQLNVNSRREISTQKNGEISQKKLNLQSLPK